MRPNHLKGKLKAGQPALGCSVMFPSPQIVEMLGHMATVVHSSFRYTQAT